MIMYHSPAYSYTVWVQLSLIFLEKIFYLLSDKVLCLTLNVSFNHTDKLVLETTSIKQ